MNNILNMPNFENTIPVFAHRFGSWQFSLQRRAFNTSELVNHYDKASAGWGSVLDRFGFPAAYQNLLGRELSKHPLPETGELPRVLDCGVGTGALSGALTRVLATPFALDAIDISPSMLEQAERRLQGSICAVTLRQGDICKLPYADNTFDLVMAAHVLEHMADPRDALKEMARVLKPGGLLIVCITRRSALGLLVQFKWRTHRVTPVQAQNWLRSSGINTVTSRFLEGGMLCRQFSIACIGTKSPELN